MTIQKLQKNQEIRATLIYEGQIAAIKLYMKTYGVRLNKATKEIKKMGQSIQPGQAS